VTGTARFWLGSHHATQRWFSLGVPLFVSRRVLTGRVRLPQAATEWALDSGGFTELSMFGEWQTTESQYVADVRRFADDVGRLAWVAPQDWMCEPFMLEKTGRTILEHQRLTVASFLRLRDQLGSLVVPVLQGWDRDDYLACWELYETEGVDLAAERLVGVGSVCRRQNMVEAALIVRSLVPLRLHGFGVKITGLASYGDALASADSMAWSYDGRRLRRPCPEGRKSCANCIHHALAWRQGVLSILNQERLEVAA
jgi:hypothetical protein